MANGRSGEEFQFGEVVRLMTTLSDYLNDLQVKTEELHESYRQGELTEAEYKDLLEDARQEILEIIVKRLVGYQ